MKKRRKLSKSVRKKAKPIYHKGKKVSKSDAKKIRAVKKQHKGKSISEITKSYFDGRISGELQRGRLLSTVISDFDAYYEVQPKLGIAFTPVMHDGETIKPYKSIAYRIDREVKEVFRRKRAKSKSGKINSPDLPLVDMTLFFGARTEIPKGIRLNMNDVYSVKTKKKGKYISALFSKPIT